MPSPPPPAPEVRGRLRAVWDRLSRRQLLDASELLAPLPAAEPSVRNARAVWHLGMRETDAALELLRPLALLPDELSFDPGADIAWRANFVLALLKADNRDGFEHYLKRLDAPDHPGVAAMRRLLDEAEKSRGRLSRWFGSAPLPELPSEFPVGWPEGWLAAEPSPPREIAVLILPLRSRAAIRFHDVNMPAGASARLVGYRHRSLHAGDRRRWQWQLRPADCDRLCGLGCRGQ